MSFHLVKTRNKAGATDEMLRTEAMRNLSCMSYMGKGNAFIVVAGCQNVMQKIDVERGRIVEEVCMAVSTYRLYTHCPRSLLSMNTP